MDENLESIESLELFIDSRIQRHDERGKFLKFLCAPKDSQSRVSARQLKSYFHMLKQKIGDR